MSYHPVPVPQGDVAVNTVGLLPMAIVGAAAYHGYRRNRSVGWAIAWAGFALLSPLITGAVAIAQGFGQEK